MTDQERLDALLTVIRRKVEARPGYGRGELTKARRVVIRVRGDEVELEVTS